MNKYQIQFYDLNSNELIVDDSGKPLGAKLTAKQIEKLQKQLAAAGVGIWLDEADRPKIPGTTESLIEGAKGGVWGTRNQVDPGSAEDISAKANPLAHGIGSLAGEMAPQIAAGTAGGMVGGAFGGAKLGARFGPWGAAVGAGLGGYAGNVLGSSAMEKLQHPEEEAAKILGLNAALGTLGPLGRLLRPKAIKNTVKGLDKASKKIEKKAAEFAVEQMDNMKKTADISQKPLTHDELLRSAQKFKKQQLVAGNEEFGKKAAKKHALDAFPDSVWPSLGHPIKKAEELRDNLRSALEPMSEQELNQIALQALLDRESRRRRAMEYPGMTSVTPPPATDYGTEQMPIGGYEPLKSYEMPEYIDELDIEPEETPLQKYLRLEAEKPSTLRNFLF